MTDYTPQQIVARGARADAEAAADAIDNHPGLEGATYSILEEDEDKGSGASTPSRPTTRKTRACSRFWPAIR
jgi:hypothetical protein